MFRNGSSGPRARDLAYGQPQMVRPSSPHRAIWMVAVAVFCTYTRLSVRAKPVARATTSCACVCTVASKRLSAFSSFSTRARTIAVSLDLLPATNWVLGTSAPGMLDSPRSARRVQRSLRYVPEDRVAGVSCHDSYFVHFHAAGGEYACTGDSRSVSTESSCPRVIMQGLTHSRSESFERVHHLDFIRMATAFGGEEV